jgi:hypothetical protein
VTLEFAPRTKLVTDEFNALDLTDHDDRIVAETLAYFRLNRDKDIRLLSCDIGPRLSARNEDLPFCRTPKDWLRKLKKHPLEDEVQQLQKKIETLSSSFASISVQLELASRPISKRYALSLEKFDALPPEKISELKIFAESRLKSLLPEDFRLGGFNRRYPGIQMFENNCSK